MFSDILALCEENNETEERNVQSLFYERVRTMILSLFIAVLTLAASPLLASPRRPADISDTWSMTDSLRAETQQSIKLLLFANDVLDD